ncbi:unnamed protein product [Angiostrongylus costaricensis]|uniref:MADF domain-containing protein n=1 Tax=Angiostrongylus costaricensis TaxID=334426 RepID=A0A0R3PME4_ANGCS|nr:unnamed protein product [Angiostrongylus costaricensis]
MGKLIEPFLGFEDEVRDEVISRTMPLPPRKWAHLACSLKSSSDDWETIRKHFLHKQKPTSVAELKRSIWFGVPDAIVALLAASSSPDPLPPPLPYSKPLTTTSNTHKDVSGVAIDHEELAQPDLATMDVRMERLDEFAYSMRTVEKQLSMNFIINVSQYSVIV